MNFKKIVIEFLENFINTVLSLNNLSTYDQHTWSIWHDCGRNTDRSHKRTPHNHTQEVRERGEVDTLDPFSSPAGTRNSHVPRGEVDTYDPLGRNGNMGVSDAKNKKGRHPYVFGGQILSKVP